MNKCTKTFSWIDCLTNISEEFSDRRAGAKKCGPFWPFHFYFFGPLVCFFQQQPGRPTSRDHHSRESSVSRCSRRDCAQSDYLPLTRAPAIPNHRWTAHPSHSWLFVCLSVCVGIRNMWWLLLLLILVSLNP